MLQPNKIIEDLFLRFKSTLGEDYDRYKNHVYRVFYNCILIDSDYNNTDKYAIAAVFHDIGIWTKNTFDYLDPSVMEAKKYLIEINKQEWSEEIGLMIYWHHKMSSYKGNHATIVENLRKADWIDLSLGLITFGYDKQTIKQTLQQLPNLGFHWFLVKASIKNLFEHPLNPLPMFKM